MVSSYVSLKQEVGGGTSKRVKLIDFLSRQASKWCEDGIYLLASQPVDKCQSQDGAESALQEIERYLDTANQHKLTDLSGIWREYDSVLTQDFRVNIKQSFFTQK